MRSETWFATSADRSRPRPLALLRQMPSDESAVAAVIVGAGVSAIATPMMIRVARRAGILDHPGGYKRHARPTPYLGGVAIIVAVALILDAEAWVALVALALLGASLAFLPFNLARPARIFLGDGGSTLLGFLIAVSAMGALFDESAPAPAAIMVLLLGIPLLDTALVMVSRWRRRVSLLTGGRDHLTHRVLARVGSSWKVAAMAATAQI